jgi:hypothetical protein
MSSAQILHARKELKAKGLTPAQISPAIVKGNLTPALTPLVTAMGGRITKEEELSVTVRLKNSTPNSAETFGGIVADLVSLKRGAVVTQLSHRQVKINFGAF